MSLAEQTAPVKVEVALEQRFLPRCGHCGERHPLAFPASAKTDPNICPGCGKPSSEAGESTIEWSDLTAHGRDMAEIRAGTPVLVDRRARFGVSMIRAGNALKRLARRIAPDA
jgi:predicted small lipoprotein YifL